MDFDHGLRDFRGICRLFPLPGVVLLPHAILPLHIFEPRYRQMTEHALADDRFVTIVQTRRNRDPYDPADPAMEDVACLGRILNHERLPDGRFNFLLPGCRRIRLIRELTEAPTLYRQAEAVLLEDDDPNPSEGPRRALLIDLFRTLADPGDDIDPDLAALLSGDVALGPLTDIVAHALSLPAEIKQSFLADCRVDRRADGLISILRSLVGQRAGGGAASRPTFPPRFSDN